ncbi:U32 family peptidase C-terminal domain-containing protein [Candidatus Woesearchaeota archaeon]|nr:U32 family peptidase C-terminal domain-containing protein [Candidatus Woesearchaeota archaeon]
MVKKTKKKPVKASKPKKAVKKQAKKAVKKKFPPKAVKKQAKTVVKKPIKLIKKPAPVIPTVAEKKTPLKIVGEVTHFYDQIKVAVIAIKKELRLGDTIEFVGHGKSFVQKVYSMQIEHEQVSVAKKGQIIGMKVAEPVKEKDLIYKKN